MSDSDAEFLESFNLGDNPGSTAEPENNNLVEEETTDTNDGTGTVVNVDDSIEDKDDNSIAALLGSEEENLSNQEEELGEEDPDLPEEVLEGDEDEVDYENFYKEVMAPFKANGRQIELKSVEEARQFMSMGANYTKKMQAISQHKKAIMMMERNEITEDKLAYAIDLLKGEPEAVKKFFADSGIDPLDVDVDSEVQYAGNSHKISDTEVLFHEVLEDVKESEGGLETIRDINLTWDKGSVDRLGNNPEVLRVIHAQKQSGVYDQVANEIARRQSLGLLSASTPFLDAYDTVGNELIKAGVIVLDARPNQTAPIARGTGRINTSANDKAKAAAITKSNGKGKVADPLDKLLSSSDEEFIKAMRGRV